MVFSRLIIDDLILIVKLQGFVDLLGLDPLTFGASGVDLGVLA